MNPLQTSGRFVTVNSTVNADLADRVRSRLREEMEARDLSQQDVADLIGWTQSKVAQKLTGRTPITLSELESLCFAVSVSITEVVRDRGFEFCAELTPTELRILERLRALGPSVVDSLLQILEPQKRPPLESRGSTKKPLLGRPRLR